jgi:hypothetical protein
MGVHWFTIPPVLAFVPRSPFVIRTVWAIGSNKEHVHRCCRGDTLPVYMGAYQCTPGVRFSGSEFHLPSRNCCGKISTDILFYTE